MLAVFAVFCVLELSVGRCGILMELKACLGRFSGKCDVGLAFIIRFAFALAFTFTFALMRRLALAFTLKGSPET
jgi:hypothetical protein